MPHFVDSSLHVQLRHHTEATTPSNHLSARTLQILREVKGTSCFNCLNLENKKWTPAEERRILIERVAKWVADPKPWPPDSKTKNMEPTEACQMLGIEDGYTFSLEQHLAEHYRVLQFAM